MGPTANNFTITSPTATPPSNIPGIPVAGNITFSGKYDSMMDPQKGATGLTVTIQSIDPVTGKKSPIAGYINDTSLTLGTTGGNWTVTIANVAGVLTAGTTYFAEVSMTRSGGVVLVQGGTLVKGQ